MKSSIITPSVLHTVRRMVATTVFATAVLGASLSAQAKDLTDVNSIVTKANEAAFYAGQDGRAETRMTIVDNQGRKQLRQFTILRKVIEKGGDQDFLVVFTRPADVKGTIFRVKKHVKSDDDRWLYLPGLDLVKRIAGGDKRTSFVGSNFFYEDVSGRNLDEDKHELIETTGKYYVVKNTPKSSANVEFSSFTVWIDKTNFMPVKTEYVNDAGKVYRRIEALKVEMKQGHPTATKMKVTDVISGAYTINEMRYIAYNMGLPDDVFTERSLRNPPKQWLSRAAAKKAVGQ